MLSKLFPTCHWDRTGCYNTNIVTPEHLPHHCIFCIVSAPFIATAATAYSSSSYTFILHPSSPMLQSWHPLMLYAAFDQMISGRIRWPLIFNLDASSASPALCPSVGISHFISLAFLLLMRLTCITHFFLRPAPLPLAAMWSSPSAISPGV